jgi:hypothetical protein
MYYYVIFTCVSYAAFSSALLVVFFYPLLLFITEITSNRQHEQYVAKAITKLPTRTTQY